ncbi:hypothetical protein Q7P37_006319 [Cladosporium fusiforme]
MAGFKILRTPTAPIAAPSSDYGSDFDDDTVTELLSQAEQYSQPANLATEVLQQQDPVVQDAPPTLQRSVLLKRSIAESDCDLSSRVVREPQIEIEYSESNRSNFSPEPSTPKTASGEKNNDAATKAPEQPGEDPRAPLDRFRSKKPLSVTDLVSPAWCEQQYWYSLTRFGRVRRTKAMKQGSSVHKVLEEQVHREVKVDVQTREDMFGLRIWNVVQGLRTLRATGMTREMEVWGILDGEVVNGIIDEINTVCSDEQAEEAMLKQEETGKQKGKPMETGQKTLTGFLQQPQNARILEEHFSNAPTSSHHDVPRTFYISDVKTRQSKSLPPNGSQSKPVYMQLMLYRRLLASLAANETPAERVFERYNLDPHATFSDSFIAEVGQLDFDSSDNEDDDGTYRSSQDSVSELLAHNSLSSLWCFMIAEFARTIPNPVPPSPTVRSSLSKLLAVEYRSGSSGDVIGKKSFVHNDKVLDDYIDDEVRWWRGQRATKGVDIEDAFKCRICEFAEGCSWREEKIEEAKRKARLRNGARKSEV